MLEYFIWFIYAVVLYISFFLLIVFLEKGRLMQEPEWPEEWPGLTVIVPAYNEEETLSKTIESIKRSEYPEEKLKVIVVNDGSKDSTREVAEKYEENGLIQLINQDNQGKGAALNRGLEDAEGDFVACLDADSHVGEHSLKNIIADIIEGDKAAVASAMKVYNPENILQRLQWVEYMVGIFLRNVMGLINSIHVTPGPLSVYRRDLLEKVGGFDEESLVEDQEIVFRFQDRQWEVGHTRKGESYTVAPSTLRGFYSQRYRWYRGSLENILKYRHMIFNPKYGDFGIFAVPTKLAQSFLSIAGLGLITYLFLSPLFRYVLNVVLDLGVLTWISTLHTPTLAELVSTLYWGALSFNVVIWLLLASLFLLSIFIAHLSAVHTEERLFGNGVIPVFIYVFWYFMFVGAMWAKVTFDFVLRREGRW